VRRQALLEWALNALQRLRPRAAVVTPDGTRLELGLFGDPAPPEPAPDPGESPLPRYIGDVKETLEAVLPKADLSLWLMVDRLDDIFPDALPSKHERCAVS
jgi:hypothetical protein